MGNVTQAWAASPTQHKRPKRMTEHFGNVRYAGDPGSGGRGAGSAEKRQMTS